MTMNNLGKPISYDTRARAAQHLTDMGITSGEAQFECIERVALELEHDKPHDAMKEALKFVDMTGAYRLMAALLTPIKEVGR